MKLEDRVEELSGKVEQRAKRWTTGGKQLGKEISKEITQENYPELRTWASRLKWPTEDPAP